MSTKRPKLEVISTRSWKGSQSLNYEQVLSFAGRVLRVTIDRDAYDDQSSLVGSLFDGTKWNRVVSLPLKDSRIQKHSYVEKINLGVLGSFEADAATMTSELIKILTIHGKKD